MSRQIRLRLTVVLALLGCAAVLGYKIGHAGAYGIPQTNTLYYTGSLQTFGAPDNSTHNMVVALYVSGSTSSPACISNTLSITCVDGQFSVPLPSSCVTVIHQNPNVLVQLTVDGTALGMTSLAAVPYAVEADTASNAAPGSALSNQITALSTVSLGAGPSNPGKSCAAILSASPSATSGMYWLKDSLATVAFQSYCDMTTSGGGWTLVWSNLRGGTAKPSTEITWVRSINTLPIYGGEPTGDLQSFEVFTGLSHWALIAPSGQLRYDWAHDYGFTPDERLICTFSLNASVNYTISLTSCTQPVGTVTPGLLSYHNNHPWSTFDQDHSGSGCATSYGNEPWWYVGCWEGAIMGPGEIANGSQFDGAYWVSSADSWGVADSAGATGAGDGWMYVR